MYCGRCREIHHRFDFDHEPVDKITLEISDIDSEWDIRDYFLLAKIVQFITETFNNFMERIY